MLSSAKKKEKKKGIHKRLFSFATSQHKIVVFFVL